MGLRRVGAVVVAVVAVLAVAVVIVVVRGGDGSGRSDRIQLVGDPPAEGWRWESYGTVRETRTVGQTKVTVFSDDPALRSRILGSARVIADADVHGCAPSHPAVADRQARPRPEGGLDTLGRVRSVAVCGYALYGGRPPLYSGRTFTGDTATRLVDAVKAAPAGSGPDESPQTCLPGERGDRLYVLVVHGSRHDQEVVVRYAGCDHNGVDDGVTRHRLTGGILEPILTGADRFGGIMTNDVAELTR